MNCGFGEAGKVGMDVDIVNVRSSGFTSVNYDREEAGCEIYERLNSVL